VAFIAAAPAILSSPARAAEQVVVRTTGGATEAAMTTAVHQPFTEATGIEVLKVPATMGKLVAMFQSGNVELDVIDYELGPATNLFRAGALDPINYDRWKLSNPADIDSSVRLPFFVGNEYFSTVLGYNTEAVPSAAHPKSWSDFWDVQRFPGPRTLPDMVAGQPPLEFALLADGVSSANLYPLDLDRAFKSLDHIRPSVPKFWTTGAGSTELLTDKEAVMGAFWSARLQVLKDGGAPVDIEWNQAMLQVQGYSIFKGARNKENAQKFVEFAMQPKIQAAFLSTLPYGPTMPAAIKLMPPSVVRNLPSSPEHRAESFLINVDWWEVNREVVNKRWTQWLLHRT
jgi:putative spermidine/putrescine transport system substrate-binding protein